MLTVDSLFQIFCECAELNPEPIEGSFCLLWTYSLTHFLFAFFCPCLVFTLLKSGLASVEEEEEHNWIFSADQLENQETGKN